jgi:[protein-PII] uridylyltransferase
VYAQEKSAATPSDGFGEQRAALLADSRLRGSDFARAYSELVDRWLARLLGDIDDVALVAVGGYGRGELAPGSDIDVILAHRGRRDIGELARGLWYPVWDAGVRLDHSVKTVAEAVAIGGRDLKAAVGLVTARTVTGDAELGAALASRALDQWRRLGRRWLPLLGDMVKERHERMGDIAYLLEPELKEGRGGLRDITALRAAALAAPVVPPEDLAALDTSDTLVAARVALHRLTGKGVDRLNLQDQAPVAEALGFVDADELMGAVASMARTVGWSGTDAWRRIDAWIEGPPGRAARFDRPLGPGIVRRDAEVAVTAQSDMTDDSLVLRVAAAAAAFDAPIARKTLDRLRAEGSLPTQTWSPNARAALLDLLGSGRGCIAAFDALDQYGLLSRILPEWGAVRSHSQHNPYHRFTVDRHLIETAVEASTLIDRVMRPDLLLFAAWLHDLGKGYPGDHTVNGCELMAQIAPRVGFPAADQDTLITLVRHHLLLADTATRRDVRDPATVANVIEAVADLETLELLHALTEADAKATGSTAWSAWKSQLVAELVTAVGDTLRDGTKRPRRRRVFDPSLEPLLEQARGGLLVWADGSTLVVVAPDRPGLFCNIAGVLALHGLDVLAADGWSSPGIGEGMAVDQFVLERRMNGTPNWPRFQDDLSLALQGDLAIDVRLADRAAAYSRLSTRTRRPVEPAVIVDDEASAEATVIEVRGPNVIGALYHAARAITGCRLDIRHAKVLTLGHEIVDSFYVADEHGAKLDPGRVELVQRSVYAELLRLVG